MLKHLLCLNHQSKTRSFHKCAHLIATICFTPLLDIYWYCAMQCLVAQLTPRTAAHQVPLYMGILQARTLEWVAMPSSRGTQYPEEAGLIEWWNGLLKTQLQSQLGGNILQSGVRFTRRL